MDKYSTMTTEQLASIDAIRNKGAFVEAFGKPGQRTVAEARVECARAIAAGRGGRS